MSENKDQNTEEKIKEAAKRVFMQKGYAATKTRDIAEESGVNLALINYYFRSKQKLFQLIMGEKLHQFASVFIPILNDEKTTINEKIDLVVENYSNTLIKEPNLAIFILSELHANPDYLIDQLSLKNTFTKSHIIKQLKQQKPNIDPLQLFLSIIGVTIFPFIAKPIVKRAIDMSDDQFLNFVNTRKSLIKTWMKQIILDS